MMVFRISSFSRPASVTATADVLRVWLLWLQVDSAQHWVLVVSSLVSPSSLPIQAPGPGLCHTERRPMESLALRSDRPSLDTHLETDLEALYREKYVGNLPVLMSLVRECHLQTRLFSLCCMSFKVQTKPKQQRVTNNKINARCHPHITTPDFEETRKKCIASLCSLL